MIFFDIFQKNIFAFRDLLGGAPPCPPPPGKTLVLCKRIRLTHRATPLFVSACIGVMPSQGEIFWPTAIDHLEIGQNLTLCQDVFRYHLKVCHLF